ncbi:MAG: hypothetical protein CL946_00995 [Ectothiorhodospiraceae bacterium]|nr:hypothetical protein [Ectothiorhodospiraceae bacterium]
MKEHCFAIINRVERNAVIKLTVYYAYILFIAMNTREVACQEFWSQLDKDTRGSLQFGSDGSIYSTNSKVRKSTDKGESWIQIAPDSIYGRTFLTESGLLVVCRPYVYELGLGLVYVSDDDGNNWRKWQGMHASTVWRDEIWGEATCFAESRDGTLLMGMDGAGVYRSSDNGLNWHWAEPEPSAHFGYGIHDILVVDDSVILVANNEGLHRSTNNGRSWVDTEFPYRRPWNIEMNSNGTVYASTQGALYMSEDKGITWIPLDFESGNFIVINNNDHIYAVQGLYGSKLYKSLDSGLHWEETGISGRPREYDSFYSLDCHPDGQLFATFLNGGLHISNGSTTVGFDPYPLEQHAESYQLLQNYPNPFSEHTTISYSIERGGLVTLAVFDPLGREVLSLIDGERKAAGMHRVELGSLRLNPGLYFYKLSFDGHSKLKRMIVK